MESSRSPAVAALSDAQLSYFQKAKELLETELPEYLSSEAGTPAESRMEAAALCTEYAIDFAVQSMRYALVAALKAIDLQMSAEENNEQKEEFNHE